MNTFFGWLVELKINLIASESNSALRYPRDIPGAIKMATLCYRGQRWAAMTCPSH